MTERQLRVVRRGMNKNEVFINTIKWVTEWVTFSKNPQMVENIGFEPMTSTLPAWCSSQLS